MLTDLQIVIIYKVDLIHYRLGPGRGGMICLQIAIMYKDDLIHYACPRKGGGLDMFTDCYNVYS